MTQGVEERFPRGTKVRVKSLRVDGVVVGHQEFEVILVRTGDRNIGKYHPENLQRGRVVEVFVPDGFRVRVVPSSKRIYGKDDRIGEVMYPNERS